MDKQDRQLWELLGAAKRPQAPDQFAASVMDKIRQETAIAEKTSWLHKLRFREIFAMRPLSLAATGLAAALALVLFYPQPGGKQANPVATVEIDDQLLVDIACRSLNDETLETALYEIASIDAVPLADRDLAEMLLNS